MKNWKFALIMGALSALGPFSIDTYFPSFPSIAEHFAVTPLDVQSTLSYYLLALASMSLFHGALSDSFGRRRVILISMAIYTVAALACPIAPSFVWLLFFRVIQGLAAGAGMVVGRAVIRDCFEGHQAQRLMAQITMVGALAPAIAPVFGGWLHVWFGWRGPFVFLGLMGTALFLACYLGLPESLPREKRQPFHPTPLTRGYWQVLRDPKFLALCFALSMAGGGFLLYVATAPDVVLNIFSLSETQFAWLFVPIVLGLMLGSALTVRLSGRISAHRMIGYAYVLMITAAALNVFYNYFYPPRVPWAVFPLVLYTLGCSMFAPVATVLCLDLFPERRGLASSLQGFVQILVFAFLSAGVARAVYSSGLKHAIAMALMVSLNWLAWRCFTRTHKPVIQNIEELKNV